MDRISPVITRDVNGFDATNETIVSALARFKSYVIYERYTKAFSRLLV